VLLAEALGYSDSPNFLPSDDAVRYGSSSLAHLFRRSAQAQLVHGGAGFQGAYVLSGKSADVPIPAVVVFSVNSDTEAREIHRLVWNQDFVPFLLIESPQSVRLYSGFQYDPKATRQPELLKTLTDFNSISRDLCSFRAKSIDDGSVWREHGSKLRTDKRVDWQLLSNLKDLSERLQALDMSRELAHAFIGRFVYLQYLKDRGFLSSRKLEKWGLQKDEIFSRNGRKSKFAELNEKLDSATDGLNGGVFPFDISRVTDAQYQLTASTFYGDNPNDGQMALFSTYDFSFIPIETLSVVYQHFLHETDPEEQDSKGKELGAYYTPIPLVNFLIAELDNAKPLDRKTRVLDPACGSGAFLVQTYRRLIERACHDNRGTPPTASKLRDILERQIFGIDIDADACRLAEMSLVITLLDYVTPPDLEGRSKGFKLPKLLNKNIFHADLFDPSSTWEESRARRPALSSFEWVIGNPPWKKLKSPPKDPRDRVALGWMQKKEAKPVSGNQLAEAFVWKSDELLSDAGVSGLVLPAMTLFKVEAKSFRQRLFKDREVRSIINFSNLAYVLFAGRVDVPAMVLCYSKSRDSQNRDAPIQTYAPFLLGQQVSQRRNETWSLTVDASEVREIRSKDAMTGSSLLWKLAMWGSARDGRLLRKLGKRHQTFEELANDCGLRVSQGFELREPKTEKQKKALEHHPELEGKKQLHFGRLKNCGAIFSFPRAAIPAECSWVREGRAKLPYLVSMPPHIIVDAARRFSVYSDSFIAVPARQIGIAGEASKTDLLRALSLFFYSDFCTFHQFFTSSEWGVQKNRNTLAALKQLPIPDLSDFLSDFNRLFDKLDAQLEAGDEVPAEARSEINSLAFEALELRVSERLLIEDFVRVNMAMVHGRRDPDLLRAPDSRETEEYLITIRSCIEGFFSGGSSSPSCQLTAIHDSAMAFIEVTLVDGLTNPPSLRRADESEAEQLRLSRDNLLQKHRQWIYFNRRLIAYENNRLYLTKPFQRIYWTRRQAILDADELIAEGLGEPSQS